MLTRSTYFRHLIEKQWTVKSERREREKKGVRDRGGGRDRGARRERKILW